VVGEVVENDGVTRHVPDAGRIDRLIVGAVHRAGELRARAQHYVGGVAGIDVDIADQHR
jgi:hypothetical protein